MQSQQKRRLARSELEAWFDNRITQIVLEIIKNTYKDGATSFLDSVHLNKDALVVSMLTARAQGVQHTLERLSTSKGIQTFLEDSNQIEWEM